MTLTPSGAIRREESVPQPQVVATSAALSSESAALQGSTLMFGGLVLVLLIEYLGLAQLIPVLRVTKFTTVFSALLVLMVLFRAPVNELFEHLQSRLLLGFSVLTALSVIWAYVATYAIESITAHVGYFGLFVLGFYLVDRRSRIHQLAWMYVLVTLVLIGWNLNKLLAGVRLGGFQGGYFLSDGNDFGWGMCIFLPLCLYLLFSKQSLPARIGGLAGAVLCLFGIVGTQSRGASLALLASVAFYWAFPAKRKVVGGALAVLVLAGMVGIAPGAYVERLSSIQHYEEDQSAMGRIYAWRAATSMALEHPLGVGASNFNTAYGRLYRTDDGPVRWISAHSVYFKALGEYGFGGLAIILLILYRNFRDNNQTRRLIISNSQTATLSEHWPAMLNMSLVGYAVAGLFLGGLMYPHLYVLTALALSAKRITKLDVSRNAVSGSGPQPRTATIPGLPRPLRPSSPSRTLWPQSQSQSISQQYQHARNKSLSRTGLPD